MWWFDFILVWGCGALQWNCEAHEMNIFLRFDKSWVAFILYVFFLITLKIGGIIFISSFTPLRFWYSFS